MTYLRPDTSFVRYSRLHASTDLCVHEQGSWKHLTHENAEILGPTAHAQREGTQRERTEARLIVADFTFMSMAVHVILSSLASFSLILVHHLFLGIPPCLGDAIKQKEKEKKRG